MKDQAITDLMSALAGKDFHETKATNQCMTCSEPNMEFTNQLSIREYNISGMCQDCQDSFFGADSNPNWDDVDEDE